MARTSAGTRQTVHRNPRKPPISVPGAPVIQSVAAVNIATTSASIDWTLDQVATGQVAYGLSSAYGLSTTPELSFNYSHHLQSISGLAPGQIYHYHVFGANAAGQSYDSGDLTFSTAQRGASILTLQAINLTPTDADIDWTLDMPATGQVEYGTTTGYGSFTTAATTPSTHHLQHIASLSASTLYHYRVRSTNAAGVETISGDQTFTTPAASGTGIMYTDYNVTAGITTTAGLQAFIDGVPNGADATHMSRINLGAGRTYTGFNGINLNSSTRLASQGIIKNVLFEGGGTDVNASPWGNTGGATIQVTGVGGIANFTCAAFYSQYSGTAMRGQNVRFHGINHIGPATAAGTNSPGTGGGEHNGFMDLPGFKTVEVAYCSTTKGKGHGMYLTDSQGAANGVVGFWCDDIHVHHTKFTLIEQGMGLAIIAASNVLIEFCYWSDVAYAVFDIEPNVAGQGFSNVQVSDCVVAGQWSWDVDFDDAMFVATTEGASPMIGSGYLRWLRNTVNGHRNLRTGIDASQYVGNFRAHHWPNNFTAVLTVEDNVNTDSTKDNGPIGIFGRWQNGGSVQRNTNFRNPSSGLLWYSDQGGNVGLVVSGNS